MCEYYQLHKEEKKIYNQKYHKEHYNKEKKKQYYQEHKEQCDARGRRWRLNNKEKVKEMDRIGYSKHKERSAFYRQKIKSEVLSHYSNGELKCSCCGENEIKFLTIDHINGRNKKDKPIDKRSGCGLYQLLRKLNFPTGFQVLCFNCNAAKSFFGICPHKLNKN